MTPQCYCGGHYYCEDCRLDVCFCACETDGAPDTTATAGHVNPSQARMDAWTEKQGLFA